MAIKKSIKIAVVEDDRYYNKALVKHIESICSGSKYSNCEFEIQSYLTAHECIEELDEDTNIMILDYYLINEEESDVLNGEDVVREVKEFCPNCKIIMISSQQDAHTTAELMRQGIYDYIDKNVNSRNRIDTVLQKAIAAVL